MPETLQKMKPPASVRYTLLPATNIMMTSIDEEIEPDLLVAFRPLTPLHKIVSSSLPDIPEP
jgi:hypothetical protein